ncbi:MAG: TOBE domain-containing protein [Alphaproteobacteria bacterium]
MKISARNQIKGKVVEIVTDEVAAKVKIDIGGGNVLTSMVLAESVTDLGLKVGDTAFAIIKSTEVMLSK